MKLLKIVPILALLVLSATVVMASHTAEVSLQPNQWTANMIKDVSLNVKNTGGDNIIMVELSVPETTDGTPIYSITEYSEPSGWKAETRIKVGQSPYKITWTTSGSGIASGESLSFGFTVRSPEEMGEYTWGWITNEAKGGTQTGSVKTAVILAPVSYFKIKVPNEATAGSSFKITLTAYDSFDKVKTDYTGTVGFSSTDARAILPVDYTFKVADQGSKDFSVKLKTALDQTITVKDIENKISVTSNPIKVGAGSLVSLTIIPDGATVNAGETVTFNAMSSDMFGNKVDVTNQINWYIDEEAAGEWTDNIYKTENQGIWTVSGTYNNLKNGVTLNVGKAVLVPTIEVPVEEEIPIEEEIVPPGIPVAELSVEGDDSIYVPAGGNDTTVLTVNNNGDTELTGVGITFAGVPSDWISVFPLTSNIDAGSSKDYLVIIYVPENETESQTITFTANSNEGATAEKEVSLSLEAAPTGGFLEAIPKNILQLGVVIIAVAAVVIIGWELWFKK
jgi:uncharacterized protein YcnI/uncharacterized cupredoxin-like copper-binding protein